MPPIIKTAFLLRAIIFLTLFSSVSSGAVLAVGTYNAADTFNGNTAPQRVEFNTTFSAVPLVFALATTAGSNSAMIRIFDVDINGFSSLIVEPGNWDGQHIAMSSVSYIAIAPGNVVLPDGTTITAGYIDTDATQGGSSFSGGNSYDNIDFATSYINTPTVITGLQTKNNEPLLNASDNPDPFLATAVHNLDSDGFDVALERLETGTGDSSVGIIPERVGWLAVEQGTGSFNLNGEEILYDFANTIDAADGWSDGGEEIAFNQNFTGTPVGVASITSRNDDDGGMIRRGSLDADGVVILIDEDRDNDNERNHPLEDVSTFFFSKEFIYVPEPSTALYSALGLLSLFIRRNR